MIFNMISGSRAAFGTLIAHARRGVTMNTGSRRFCIKPHEGPPVPQQAPPVGFKVPGYRPSAWDIKMLLWSGRFKTKEQIPEFVSFEMIDAARNRVRVKACYLMMGLTLLACLMMAISGKQAIKQNDNLTTRNMEQKAHWREEAQKDRLEPAVVAEKTQ